METCKKCEGLNAAFGWNGNVKIADSEGQILFGGANDFFYSDFYKRGNPLEWPVCPECKRSLDVYVEDPNAKEVPGWLTVLGVTVVCSLVWGLLIWGIYQIG